MGAFQCHAINYQINIQIKHNWVKNPNWPKANQLTIYKRGWKFETQIFCETNPASKFSNFHQRTFFDVQTILKQYKTRFADYFLCKLHSSGKYSVAGKNKTLYTF